MFLDSDVMSVIFIADKHVHSILIMNRKHAPLSHKRTK